MLKFANVSVNGEVGQLRSNDEQLAWRGAETRHMVVLSLASLKGAEWSDNGLSLAYGDETRADVLHLAGLSGPDRETLCLHLETHALIAILGWNPSQTTKALPHLLDVDSVAYAPKLVRNPQTVPGAEASEKSRSSSNAAPHPLAPGAKAGPSRGRILQPLGRRDDAEEDVDSTPAIEGNFAPAVRFVSGGATVIREAWLWKRSAWMKKWEHRYVVLRSDGLFSYRCKQAQVPSVAFDSLRSCEAGATESGSLFTFSVTKKGVGGGCTLACEDAKQRGDWVESIRAVLLRSY